MNIDLSSTGNARVYCGTPEARTPSDILKSGRSQLIAGYAAYGPQTGLIQTIGKNVQIFTLDDDGIYRLTMDVTRASILGWLRDPDAAFAALNQALAHDPHSARALTNRGLAYFNNGDTSRALADLDAALALSPDDSGIYGFRAAARRKSGDEVGATADERKMANLMMGTGQSMDHPWI